MTMLRALTLDLNEDGDFLLAQRTLNTFRVEIAAKLEIDVDIDNPDAARASISVWLHHQPAEGALDGRQS
jgi:hypothetical protein